MQNIQWNSSNGQLHWFPIDFLMKWSIMDQDYANANAFFSVAKKILRYPGHAIWKLTSGRFWKFCGFLCYHFSNRDLKDPTRRHNFDDTPGQIPKLILTLRHIQQRILTTVKRKQLEVHDAASSSCVFHIVQPDPWKKLPGWDDRVGNISFPFNSREETRPRSLDRSARWFR